MSKLVFHPPKIKYPPNTNHMILLTENGTKIQMSFINRNAPITIIFSHGNAEDLYEMEEWVRTFFLKKIHANAVIYGIFINLINFVEYSGYNENQDFRPTENSVFNDIIAVYKYLTINLEINPKSIILYGKSVGSGPSCFLAEKKVIGGLILHSAFTSILRIVFDVRFTFSFDMFANIDRIANIHCPTFIIHGQIDEIVSVQHAIELYKKAGNKVRPLIVPNGGHNNLEEYSKDYFKRMNEFIENVQSNINEHSY